MEKLKESEALEGSNNEAKLLSDVITPNPGCWGRVQAMFLFDLNEAMWLTLEMISAKARELVSIRHMLSATCKSSDVHSSKCSGGSCRHCTGVITQVNTHFLRRLFERALIQRRRSRE